jgi:glycopeptide antibiotics resistance protein
MSGARQSDTLPSIPTSRHAVIAVPFLNRERLVERAILLYALVFVAVLTLSPMEFAWPAVWHVAWWSDWQDLPANVLFFIPVGYLFVLARAPERPRPVWAAALFGSLLSAGVECTQQFIPVRLTSLTDLLGNGLGATLGGWLCTVVRAQLERVYPDLLTLDHPLLNVVYLILPLMGLASIDEHGHSPRTWLLLPLGLMGVITLTGLWRYRLAERKPASPLTVVLAVLAWFLSGASLASLRAPGIVVICAMAVLFSTLALLARDPRWVGEDGRFERRVLARLWPCLLVYLGMLVFWRPGFGFSSFHAGLWYPPIEFSRHLAVRVAEQGAALTLFGYLAAETAGRNARSARRGQAICVAIGAACALAMELAHGFVINDQASVGRGALSILGAGFGVFLYAARINVLRMLRGDAGVKG